MTCYNIPFALCRLDTDSLSSELRSRYNVSADYDAARFSHHALVSCTVMLPVVSGYFQRD